MDNSENEAELIEGIRQAILRGDQTSLEKVTYDLDSHLMELGSFPAKLFEDLLGIVGLPEFLSMEGSVILLKVFEYDFDYLTEEQKTELVATLAEFYDSFSDFTSCFLIAEIVGELYGGERGLQTLRRLKASKADMPRSLVPHGLEYFVKNSTDERLAKQAFDELLQMRSDPSEDVRDEVNTSLTILKKHGWPKT